MKLFFTETQLAHSPSNTWCTGSIVDPFENPNRATTLIESLERAGLHAHRAQGLRPRSDPEGARRALRRFPRRSLRAVHGAAEPRPRGAAQRASLSRRLARLRRPRAAARHGHHRPRRLVHGRHVVRDDGGHVPRGLCLGADGDRRRRGGPVGRARRLLAVPPARPSRLRRPLLGLLLPQQRRHRRRGAAAQVPARRHHRFRHPPRRRHAGDLLCTAPTCSTARCTPTRPPTTRTSPATPTKPAQAPARAPT